MRKSTLLKLTLILTALFMIVNVNAQVADNNYVDATGVVTMQTATKTVRLYVEPDALYNPNYVNPGWTISPKARWTWTYAGLTGAPASAAAANQNYVEFTTPAVGNYAINVVESNTDLPGTCVDAGVDHTLVVLPAPSMAVNAGASAWGATCGPITGHAVSFSLTAATLANDYILAQWRLKEYTVTIDGATGNPIIGAQVGADAVHIWNKFLTTPQTIGGQSWAMADGGEFNADGVAAPALSNLALSMTRDYTNTGGTIAYLYRWELTASDGVSDRISRKSEYIDGGTGTYVTVGTIDIYVLNTPTTGPIYHIPNAFGN